MTMLQTKPTRNLPSVVELVKKSEISVFRNSNYKTYTNRSTGEYKSELLVIDPTKKYYQLSFKVCPRHKIHKKEGLTYTNLLHKALVKVTKVNGECNSKFVGLDKNGNFIPEDIKASYSWTYSNNNWIKELTVKSLQPFTYDELMLMKELTELYGAGQVVPVYLSSVSEDKDFYLTGTHFITDHPMVPHTSPKACENSGQGMANRTAEGCSLESINFILNPNSNKLSMFCQPDEDGWVRTVIPGVGLCQARTCKVYKDMVVDRGTREAGNYYGFKVEIMTATPVSLIGVGKNYMFGAGKLQHKRGNN